MRVVFKKKSLLLSLVLIFNITAVLGAEFMKIHKTDGTVVELEVTNDLDISFTDTNNSEVMSIFKTDNTTDEYNTSEIDLITFSDGNSIDEDGSQLTVTDSELKQNYPNPFNPVTKINYELGIKNYKSAKIVVYNIAGQIVWSSQIAHNALSAAGSVQFNGSAFNSGVYYYSLIVDNAAVSTKSMVLLK